MNGHGKKWNLITSGDYNYYKLSDEITPGITPNDPNHCLTPEIGKSYDKDLLLEIDEIYTRPDQPTIEEPEIDPTYYWINPLTLTAQEDDVTVQIVKTNTALSVLNDRIMYSVLSRF